MTPLEAVAALWRLKHQRPAEYRRLVAKFDAAIQAEASRPNPVLAMMAKRGKSDPGENYVVSGDLSPGVKSDPSAT